MKKDTRFGCAICDGVLQIWYRLFPCAIERRFMRTWTALLKKHADVYCGVYAGIWRAANGKGKNADKVLNEWLTRTRYKVADKETIRLCRLTLLPAIDSKQPERLSKWASLLLEAAYEAGIETEKKTELMLDENNAKAYVEWNGADIYPGDQVYVIQPAWYQNGGVIEQGYCKMSHSSDDVVIGHSN